LLLTRSFYFFIVILFIGGCSSKEMDYTYNSYHRGGGLSSSSGSGSYKYVHPRDEKIKDSVAMHRATMRSYEVAGVTYHPYFVNTGATYVAIASWYGPNFHERKTSNGETYNMYAYTAAHKTFPMNTIVKVTNLENSKEVIVRINDRGPFVHGRIIDLSNAAAHKIDMVKDGTTKVQLIVVGTDGIVGKEREDKTIIPKSKKKIEKILIEKKINDVIEEVISQNNLYHIQVGAFSNIEGANLTKSKYQQYIKNSRYKIILVDGVYEDFNIKKVWITGFQTEKEAYEFKVANNLENIIIGK